MQEIFYLSGLCVIIVYILCVFTLSRITMNQYLGEVVLCLLIVGVFVLFTPIETGGKKEQERAGRMLDKFNDLLFWLRGAGIKSYYIIKLLLRWVLFGLIIYVFRWWSLLIFAGIAIILTIFKSDK